MKCGTHLHQQQVQVLRENDVRVQMLLLMGSWYISNDRVSTLAQGYVSSLILWMDSICMYGDKKELRCARFFIKSC